MVASSPVPHISKVEAIYPPAWLVRLVGTVSARFMTFFWVGLRKRPEYVGGFHILPNGLATVLLARMIGARSLYFNGGGPTEVIGGGYLGNRIFRRLKAPDFVIEKLLLRTVSAFDIVIVMGSRTIEFFKSYGVTTVFCIEPVGKDETRFFSSFSPRNIDLILVARLSQVKRVDIFLEAIRETTKIVPDVRATIVGDGPLKSSLQMIAQELGISENVAFVGHQDNVEVWLRDAKIFVLTSDSEGLPLSLIEAMMCGLPVIAPNVGDLADLVNDGVNGYLVAERSPVAFARYFVKLLTNPRQLAKFSESAVSTTVRYKIKNASRIWNNVLTSNIV
jgi:glycosyltransferase involved in cell wall biosynthesis